MSSMAARLVSELTERGETLSFCESLTAGLASATVASVPGASAVLRGGLITYATEVKSHLAAVVTVVTGVQYLIDGKKQNS